MASKFSELLVGLKQAVVDAGREISNQNLKVIERYFDPVEDDGDDEANAETAAEGGGGDGGDGGAGGDGGDAGGSDGGDGGGSDGGNDGGYSGPQMLQGESGQLWTPKMAKFQIPIEDSPDGPSVKTIYVPLIALVPQNTLTIEEVRVVTEIEFYFSPEEDKENPTNTIMTDLKGSRTARSQTALIEVKLKGGESPDAYARIVEAYDKGVRNQLS